ncbi:RNA-binding S4 domain-containing protein [Dokdonella sp.]|uniref:RNA-binding S4 domain-containing protein n=1 Tax=Dokdonella sp. TaxID=2291710 RepID=UPI003C689DCC
MAVETETAGVRLDLWLWAARFFKTRSLAKQAIDGGKIVVNDTAAKASRAVHVGDRLGVVRGIERMQVVVLGLSAKRGPASQAQSMYEETAESIAARERAREQRRLTGAGLDHPASRPDKHSRRLLRDFKKSRG